MRSGKDADSAATPFVLEQRRHSAWQSRELYYSRRVPPRVNWASVRGSPNALLGRLFQRFLFVQDRLRPEPLRYLLLFGHMRSGSTMVAHVLASHPEIRGIGESWLEYDRPERLRDLARWVHLGLKKPFLDETYVLDKILHNDLFEDFSLLRLPAVRSIFLVRSAERTLVSLYANRTRLLGISDWPSAIDYYEGRLARLAALARSADDPSRSLFVRYDELVERPKECLGIMTSFLDLRSALDDRYAVTSRTGVAGLGDFSPHIRSGKIVKTTAQENVAVPTDVLERGKAAYEACTAMLAASCTSVSRR